MTIHLILRSDVFVAKVRKILKFYKKITFLAKCSSSGASLQNLLTFSAVKIFDFFFKYLACFFLNISYQMSRDYGFLELYKTLSKRR